MLELSIMFPPCLPATIAEKGHCIQPPFERPKRPQIDVPRPTPEKLAGTGLGGHFEPEKSISLEPKKFGSPEPVLRNRFWLQKTGPRGGGGMH